MIFVEDIILLDNFFLHQDDVKKNFLEFAEKEIENME